MSAACLMLALVTLTARAENLIMAGRKYNVMDVWWKGAQGRLILDDGALLYTKYPDKKFYILKDGVDEMVEDLPEGGMDLLLDSSRIVWVANSNGLYRYSRPTKWVTKFSDIAIDKLTATANGTIYGLSILTRVLFVARQHRIEIVIPWIRAYCIAMSKAGDMYYTFNGLKKIGGQAKVEEAERPEGVEEVEGAKEAEKAENTVWTAGGMGAVNITAPPWGNTKYLEVDPIYNTLYICHDDGLYYVRPGTDRAIKVPTIEGPVLGVGFTPSGDIFVGKEDKVIKLTLLSGDRFDKRSNLYT